MCIRDRIWRMIQTNSVHSNDDQGSTKVENFMNPRVGVLVLRCGHISHLVNHFFSSSCIHFSMDQINYIVMKTKEGSNEIINFMIPGAGVLVLDVNIK